MDEQLNKLRSMIGGVFPEGDAEKHTYLARSILREFEYEQAAIREQIAKVITTEGCSCCEHREHKALKDELAKALNIPRYSDDSGYNWYTVAGK